MRFIPRGSSSLPLGTMEISFLGTSSGWPLPRLGCTCNICSSKDAKDARLRPSILVDNKLLIDAPADIYHQLKKYKIDPRKISHILITHGHDDHISGLYDLTHIYNKSEKIKLISTKGVLSQIRKRVGISVLSFKTIEAKPFQKFEIDNNTCCWFVPVKHTVEAYGIKIKSAKPFLYAPEFRKIIPSSRKLLADLDLAVIDGSSKTRDGQAKGHETIEEGIRLAGNIKAKKILFTNIGHKTDSHKNLENFVKETGGSKFGIAFDGLAVKV